MAPKGPICIYFRYCPSINKFFHADSDKWMGRIGRLLTRRLFDLDGVELVAVNDIMDTDNLAYLLRYDSIYGTLPFPVVHAGGQFSVQDRKFRVFRQEDPSKLPWKELGVDIVLECSGVFQRRRRAASPVCRSKKRYCCRQRARRMYRC